MTWTLEYTISQILVIVVYGLLALTYCLNKRKKILITNILAHIIQAISFILLKGFLGASMDIVYILRDTFFLVDEKKYQSHDISKKDIAVLVFLMAIIIIFTILTYNGLASLFSVFATIIATIAIWQKNIKIYKILGIPISIFWFLYNISLNSIFGIVLESILLTLIIYECVSESKKR